MIFACAFFDSIFLLLRLTDWTSPSLGDELQEVAGHVLPVVHVQHGGAVPRLGDGGDLGQPRYINVLE